MLRPFPQYSGVNADFVNLANSNYNSLQITLQKRMSAGLTFNINHTWSKTMSDAGVGRSAYFWEIEKTHGESDRRHVFNALVVYELPFGKGRAITPSNAVVAGSGKRLADIEHHSPSLRPAVRRHRRSLHTAQCRRLQSVLQPGIHRRRPDQRRVGKRRSAGREAHVSG